MTGSAALVTAAATEHVVIGHVLTGADLTGPAAKLASCLDPAFLTDAGWDPAWRVLSLPAGHRLLGRTVCRVGGCISTALGRATGGVCWRCFTRLGAQGLTGPQIESLPELPPLPDRPAGCAVPGCQRMSPAPRSTLCAPHSNQFRRGPWASLSLEQFAADPLVRPLSALDPCQVAACTRRTESGHAYCPTHYQRWRTAIGADPATDRRHWQATQSAVSEGGQVSLRGLPPLVVVEMLFGVQRRVQGGGKVKDVTLRAVCDTTRRRQVLTIADLPVEAVPGKPARSLLNAMVRDVRRALTDPRQERPATAGTWPCSATLGGSRSPVSASRGWPGPPRRGPVRNCPGTAAAAPPRSGRRSMPWPGSRKACAPATTMGWPRTGWAARISRSS